MRLSVDDEPESDDANKSGTDGATGAMVSIVITSAGETGEMFPTASVAVVVIE